MHQEGILCLVQDVRLAALLGLGSDNKASFQVPSRRRLSGGAAQGPCEVMLHRVHGLLVLCALPARNKVPFLLLPCLDLFGFWVGEKVAVMINAVCAGEKFKCCYFLCFKVSSLLPRRLNVQYIKVRALMRYVCISESVPPFFR